MIRFKAVYGDEEKEVELNRPSGGGNLYHIYIDRFYYGIITIRGGEWAVLPQHDHYFTPDDMDALVDRVVQEV